MAGDVSPGSSGGDKSALHADQASSDIHIDPRWQVRPELDLTPDHKALIHLPDFSVGYDAHRHDDQPYSWTPSSGESRFDNTGVQNYFANGHFNVQTFLQSDALDALGDSAKRNNMGIGLNVGGSAIDLAGVPEISSQHSNGFYESQFARIRKSEHPTVGFTLRWNY